MRTLGIDYGRSKVGIAIGIGSFAEPLKVIRYSDTKILEEEIKKIVVSEKIDKIVIGMSEGAMGTEIERFIKTIRHTLLPIPCEEFDETLTSKDAQTLSIQAGVPQKKRHALEDAYAASIMLQSYLDSI